MANQLRRHIDIPRQKKTKKSSTAADIAAIQLPDDLAAHNKKPWLCLRDAVAVGTFTAAQIRATEEGKSLDVTAAMQAMERSCLKWSAADTTVFIIWTSVGDNKKELQHHLKLTTFMNLCKRCKAVE